MNSTHSVTFDHDNCGHTEGDTSCNPQVATFRCDAPEDAYCRYGCEDDSCIEQGWTDIGFLRLWCSKGHRLTQHYCWVDPWVLGVDVCDSYADEDHDLLADGPIEVVEWTDEYLTWRMAAAK